MKHLFSGALALLLSLLFLFSSCDGNAVLDSMTINADDDGRPVRVLVPADTGLANCLKQAASLYQSVSGSTVTVEEVPYDAYDGELHNQMEAGNGPDLLFFSDYIRGDEGVLGLIEKEGLEDLTGYLEPDRAYEPDRFVEPVVAGGRMGRRQLVFPIAYDVPLFYALGPDAEQYNIPTGKEADRAEFFDKIKGLDEQVRMGLFRRVFLYGLSSDFTYSASRGFYDLENKRLLFDEGETTEALTLLFNHYMSSLDYAIQFPNGDYGGGLAHLRDRKAALISTDNVMGSLINYTLTIEAMQDKTLELIALPSASGGGGHDALITGSVGMNGACGHKNRAYDFLSFCVNSSEFHMLWMGSGASSGISPNKKAILQMISQGTTDEYYQSLVDTYGERAAAKVFDPAWQNQMVSYLQDGVQNAFLVDSVVLRLLDETLDGASRTKGSAESFINEFEYKTKEYLGYE